MSLAVDDLRIGHGIDVHRFAPERKLILGGVEIPHTVGLLGHSDADVVLHAVADAVLGALAWGDIGKWFPDTDEAYRGADSKQLLAQVWKAVSAERWALVNVDIAVLAERPKLAPHVERMRENIGGLMGSDSSRVSIKATTTELLGFVGREEGILASATVLLQRPR